MTLSDVVETSRQHNIAISRTGVYHGSKGFNKKFIDDKFWKAPSVGYLTNLIGVNAKIDLKVSPEWPNRIYEIRVLFSGLEPMSKEFKAELLKMLSRKYGRPQHASALLLKTYRWNFGNNDELMLTISTSPYLTYTDIKLKKHVQRIQGYKHKNEKRGYTMKDSGKF